MQREEADQPTCVACGYSLHRITADACPECGHSVAQSIKTWRAGLAVYRGPYPPSANRINWVLVALPWVLFAGVLGGAVRWLVFGDRDVLGVFGLLGCMGVMTGPFWLIVTMATMPWDSEYRDARRFACGRRLYWYFAGILMLLILLLVVLGQGIGF